MQGALKAPTKGFGFWQEPPVRSVELHKRKSNELSWWVAEHRTP
jgi:hypothetical protein